MSHWILLTSPFFFRYSTEVLQTMYVSWLYREDFIYAEYLNTKVHWLTDFGLYPFIDKIKPERQGLFIQNQMIPEDSCPGPEPDLYDCRTGSIFNNPDEPLTLKHYLSLFYALGIGYLISIIAFFYEIFIHL